MLPSLLFLKINFQVSTHGNGVIVCCHLSADVSLYFVFPCALCPPPGWSLLAISFYFSSRKLSILPLIIASDSLVLS